MDLSAVYVFVACGLLAGQFANHLWRILSLVLARLVLNCMPWAGFESPAVPWWVWPALFVAFMYMPWMRPNQPTEGCVFVTGCDSGMGYETAIALAGKRQYDLVFAGVYSERSGEKLKEKVRKRYGEESVERLVPVQIDVTDEKSVRRAAEEVQKRTEGMNEKGLVALANFAGVAFNGPVEYMPIELFQRQMDVNFFGYVRTTQAFLPLIKKTVSNKRARRGRIIYTGTGGGVCSPCPPLLSAYMSSKFAVSAFCQSFRLEMRMKRIRIDCCEIHPGFIKPTQLMAEGLRRSNKMWEDCKRKFKSDVAKKEYGDILDHFIKYSEAQPGTHVSKVVEACEKALRAWRPTTSYKVGIDSWLAPFPGMLPTGAREYIANNGIYGFLSPIGSISNKFQI